MRAIDGDRLLEERRIHTYYHLPNGDIAIPLIDIKNAPTIEPRCETCEAFNKTRLLIPQPEPQWIPCSKELPERNRVVLVTTKWDEVTEGVKLSGNAWFIGRGEENAFDSDIIAWMPKPEPYKEGR